MKIMTSLSSPNKCFSYRDYFGLTVDEIKREIHVPKGKRKGPRGGVVVPFPVKLYAMLEGTQKEGFEHIVSWQPHGRCFMVHEPTEFVNDILPRYFCQSKLTSFQRQLNLYGFQRLINGPDRGGYYHELFLNGRPDMCKIILRTRVKGGNSSMKPAGLVGQHQQEPDLYTVPACSPSLVQKDVLAAVYDSADESTSSSSSSSVEKHQVVSSDDASTHSLDSSSGSLCDTFVRTDAIIEQLEALPQYRPLQVVSSHVPPSPQQQQQCKPLGWDSIPPCSTDFSSLRDLMIPDIMSTTFKLPMTATSSQFARQISFENDDNSPLVIDNDESSSSSSSFFEDCTPFTALEEEALFEGRSFQCIDDDTLISMESICLIE